jgi:hypothetical protein
MGKRGASDDAPRISGITMRPMVARGESAVCLMPYGNRWHARTDIPWDGSTAHLASTAAARTPEAALERSLAGALYSGDDVCGNEMLEGLRCVGAELLTEGSIFSSIAKLARPLASAALPMAASVIPGGSMALEAAKSLLPGGGGMPPGSRAVELPMPSDGPKAWIFYHPSGAPGPVVARLR